MSYPALTEPDLVPHRAPAGVAEHPEATCGLLSTGSYPLAPGYLVKEAGS
jgi:hypothetical protein